MLWPRMALAGIGLFVVAHAAAQETSSFPRTLSSPQTSSFPQAGPAHQRYSAVGLASWYGSEVGGGATADGEVFTLSSLSAAHRTMPLPSYARVTNLSNGRSIVVRVNDRGPFVRGRIVDVSSRVAKLLGFDRRGVAKVRLDYIGKAPPAGGDEPALLASLHMRESLVAQTAQPAAPPVREPAPRPRSPYGELVAYSYAELSVLRWDSAPPP